MSTRTPKPAASIPVAVDPADAIAQVASAAIRETMGSAPVVPLLVDRAKARDGIAEAVYHASKGQVGGMVLWACTCPTEEEPERWCEHQYADGLLDIVAIGAPALQAMDRDAALQAANRLRGAIVNGGTVNPDVAMAVVDWVERLAGHED